MIIILYIISGLLGVYLGTCAYSMAVTDILREDIRKRLCAEGYDKPKKKFSFSLKSIKDYLEDHILSFHPVFNVIASYRLFKKRHSFVDESVKKYMETHPLVRVMPTEDERTTERIIDTPFGQARVKVTRINFDDSMIPPELQARFGRMKVHFAASKPPATLIEMDEDGQIVGEKTFDEMTLAERIAYLKAQESIIQDYQADEKAKEQPPIEADFTIK